MYGLFGHPNVLCLLLSKIIPSQSFLFDPTLQSDFLSDFIHDMMSYGPMDIWFLFFCLGSGSAKIYATCRYSSPPHVPITRETNICRSHYLLTSWRGLMMSMFGTYS